jgi:hypothetical protein
MRGWNCVLAKLRMTSHIEHRFDFLIDPLFLAVSMHARKGIYAVLLGSDVSRSEV